MDYMFADCESLEEIDLESFNTSSAITLSGMFYNCISLKSINISNFETRKVKSIDSMFYNNRLLVSIDLSNFDTTHILRMQNLFDGCEKLEYINLQNFNEKYSPEISSMFQRISRNPTLAPKIYKLANQSICGNFSCHTDWKSAQKGKYTYNNICYEKCPKNTVSYNGLDCIFKCDLQKCKSCNNESDALDLCISCNSGYYPKINDKNNINGYINCYDNIKEKYYLDKNVQKFMPCYKSCGTCNTSGTYENNKCLTCDPNYEFPFKSGSYYNCYTCNNYYFNNFGTFICLNEKICPQNFSNLIEVKRQCIDKCSNDLEYKYEFRNKCYKKCPDIISQESKNKIFYCESICTKTKPFEIIYPNMKMKIQMRI